MKLWNDLVAAALIGTARTPLPPLAAEHEPLDRLLASLPDRPPAGRLLSAAAVTYTWMQAGAQPPHTDLPRPAPAPTDASLPCPPKAAACLTDILRDLALSSRQRDTGCAVGLLQEWLGRLADHQATLPYHHLPELLDMAWQQPDLRPAILLRLGPRGRWLAAQHPDWQWLVWPDDPQAVQERWETAALAMRLLMAQEIRRSDPARARELIALTWKQDPAADRIRLVEALAIGLSPADEPFLESLLDDRSKQVRAAATGLLSHLPDSALARRMIARLSAYLNLKQKFLAGPALQISLPANCTPDMARDGIAESPPSGWGQRAWWLTRMLASTPPAHWLATWKQPPARLVDLAANAEHGGALIEGWACAAAHQGDGLWAEALLRRWIEQPWPGQIVSSSSCFCTHLDRLVEAVPQERLEIWLAATIRSCANLEEHTNLLSLLQQHRRPWGQELTVTVIDAVRAMSHTAGNRGWQWRSSLPSLALYVSLALADWAEPGWGEASPWQEPAAQFAHLVHTRARMAAAFENKENRP